MTALITLLVILSPPCVFGQMQSEANANSNQQHMIQALFQKVSQLEDKVESQQIIIESQQQHIISMETTITRRQDWEKNIEDGLWNQNANIASLKASIENHENQFENILTQFQDLKRADKYQEIFYEQQEYGCILDAINLICPVDSVINVTYAIYGQYENSCSDCCTPGSQDCYEAVAENDISNWLTLKLGCDNTTTCSYNYTGQVINQCGVGYVADYMLIYYNCVGGAEPGNPVGFTAYATTSRDYTSGETMLFDATVTNLGGHFNPYDSIFRCPYEGVYMFSVNVLAQPGKHAYGAIWKNDEYLVDTFADIDIAEVDVFSQASTMVITECGPHQEVSVRATWDSHLYGNPAERHSSFSGYLLQQYL